MSDKDRMKKDGEGKNKKLQRMRKGSIEDPKQGVDKPNVKEDKGFDQFERDLGHKKEVHRKAA